MLTSKEILRMLFARAGTVELGRAGRQRRRASATQKAFLDELVNDRETRDHDPKPHLHPGDAGRNDAPFPREADSPLTEVELAWLTRLPSDPAAIGHRDSVQLATIARTMPPTRNDQKMLVDSIWGPIKEFHDVAAAEAALDVANATRIHTPASTLDALVDALRVELGQHTNDEVVSRARTLIADNEQERRAQKEAAIAAAEAAIAAARAEVQARSVPSSDLNVYVKDQQRRRVITVLERALSHVDHNRRRTIIDGVDPAVFTDRQGNADENHIRQWARTIPAS